MDDAALQALTAFYASAFPPAGGPRVALLDLCSSWVRHVDAIYR